VGAKASGSHSHCTGSNVGVARNTVPGPPSWGLGVSFITSPWETICVAKLNDGFRTKEEEAFVVKEVLRGPQRQASIRL
jgi:hypothetical protein